MSKTKKLILTYSVAICLIVAVLMSMIFGINVGNTDNDKFAIAKTATSTENSGQNGYVGKDALSKYLDNHGNDIPDDGATPIKTAPELEAFIKNASTEAGDTPVVAPENRPVFYLANDIPDWKGMQLEGLANSFNAQWLENVVLDGCGFKIDMDIQIEQENGFLNLIKNPSKKTPGQSTTYITTNKGSKQNVRSLGGIAGVANNVEVKNVNFNFLDTSRFLVGGYINTMKNQLLSRNSNRDLARNEFWRAASSVFCGVVFGWMNNSVIDNCSLYLGGQVAIAGMHNNIDDDNSTGEDNSTDADSKSISGNSMALGGFAGGMFNSAQISDSRVDTGMDFNQSYNIYVSDDGYAPVETGRKDGRGKTKLVACLEGQADTDASDNAITATYVGGFTGIMQTAKGVTNKTAVRNATIIGNGHIGAFGKTPGVGEGEYHLAASGGIVGCNTTMSLYSGRSASEGFATSIDTDTGIVQGVINSWVGVATFNFGSIYYNDSYLSSKNYPNALKGTFAMQGGLIGADGQETSGQPNSATLSGVIVTYNTAPGIEGDDIFEIDKQNISQTHGFVRCDGWWFGTWNNKRMRNTVPGDIGNSRWHAAFGFGLIAYSIAGKGVSYPSGASNANNGMEYSSIIINDKRTVQKDGMTQTVDVPYMGNLDENKPRITAESGTSTEVQFNMSGRYNAAWDIFIRPNKLSTTQTIQDSINTQFEQGVSVNPGISADKSVKDFASAITKYKNYKLTVPYAKDKAENGIVMTFTPGTVATYKFANSDGEISGNSVMTYGAKYYDKKVIEPVVMLYGEDGKIDSPLSQIGDGGYYVNQEIWKVKKIGGWSESHPDGVEGATDASFGDVLANTDKAYFNNQQVVNYQMTVYNGQLNSDYEFKLDEMNLLSYRQDANNVSSGTPTKYIQQVVKPKLISATWDEKASNVALGLPKSPGSFTYCGYAPNWEASVKTELCEGDSYSLSANYYERKSENELNPQTPATDTKGYTKFGYEVRLNPQGGNLNYKLESLIPKDFNVDKKVIGINGKGLAGSFLEYNTESKKPKIEFSVGNVTTPQMGSVVIYNYVDIPGDGASVVNINKAFDQISNWKDAGDYTMTFEIAVNKEKYYEFSNKTATTTTSFTISKADAVYKYDGKALSEMDDSSLGGGAKLIANREFNGTAHIKEIMNNKIKIQLKGADVGSLNMTADKYDAVDGWVEDDDLGRNAGRYRITCVLDSVLDTNYNANTQIFEFNVDKKKANIKFGDVVVTADGHHNLVVSYNGLDQNGELGQNLIYNATIEGIVPDDTDVFKDYGIWRAVYTPIGGGTAVEGEIPVIEAGSYKLTFVYDIADDDKVTIPGPDGDIPIPVVKNIFTTNYELDVDDFLTVTVAPRDISIEINDKIATYGDQDMPVITNEYVFASGCDGFVEKDNMSITLKYQDGTTTFVDAGEYAIEFVSMQGDGMQNYNFTGATNGVFTLNKLVLSDFDFTVDGANGGRYIFRADAFKNVTTSGTGIDIINPSTDATDFGFGVTFNESLDGMINVGDYNVVLALTEAAAKKFEFVGGTSSVQKDLSVEKLDVTANITTDIADAIRQIVYGTANFELDQFGYEFLMSELSALIQEDLNAIVTAKAVLFNSNYDSTNAEMRNVGEYLLGIIENELLNNYNFTLTNSALNVTAKELNVTSWEKKNADDADLIYDGENKTLGVTFGENEICYNDTIDPIFEYTIRKDGIDGNKLNAAIDAGIYTAQVVGSGNGNYLVVADGLISDEFTITQREVSIDVADFKRVVIIGDGLGTFVPMAADINLDRYFTYAEGSLQILPGDLGVVGPEAGSFLLVFEDLTKRDAEAGTYANKVNAKLNSLHAKAGNYELIVVSLGDMIIYSEISLNSLILVNTNIIYDTLEHTDAVQFGSTLDVISGGGEGEADVANYAAVHRDLVKRSVEKIAFFKHGSDVPFKTDEYPQGMEFEWFMYDFIDAGRYVITINSAYGTLFEDKTAGTKDMTFTIDKAQRILTEQELNVTAYYNRIVVGGKNTTDLALSTDTINFTNGTELAGLTSEKEYSITAMYNENDNYTASNVVTLGNFTTGFNVDTLNNILASISDSFDFADISKVAKAEAMYAKVNAVDIPSVNGKYAAALDSRNKFVAEMKGVVGEAQIVAGTTSGKKVNGAVVAAATVGAMALLACAYVVIKKRIV